jgi:arylformamidase
MDLNFPLITDWSAAYNNRAAVPEVGAWMAATAAASQAFRAAYPGRVEADVAYGPHERERYDLWHPEGEARGTQVFFHGGYWRAGDKASYWHLAQHLLAAGWRVAFITYPLCPAVTLAQITRSAQHAIEHLAHRVPEGPLVLSGHSAGGHLVTWLASTASTLAPAVRERIPRVVSLSGVHDLRPMRRSDELNVDLRLSADEAAALSPVLYHPASAFELVCVAGSTELPEFRRQSLLLAALWAGLGVPTRAVEIDGAHHFTLLDGLLQRDSVLTALLA